MNGGIIFIPSGAGFQPSTVGVGLLHIFYFHPENLGRCSPILTTFAYFFRWVGGEKPPTRLQQKIANGKARKAGDRTLTSFVLRHCSEIFKGAVHRVTFSDFGPRKDPLRFVTKKNWLLKSVVLGEEILRTYIYEDFRTSPYKDPYYITNYIVWWNADIFYFIFFRCSIGHFRFDKSTKAKVKCPDHHCQVFSREAPKILMRCRGADFLVTQIYKRIPRPSIFDSNF